MESKWYDKIKKKENEKRESCCNLGKFCTKTK